MALVKKEFFLCVHVYDIDGILIKSGHDFWFQTMLELCEAKGFISLVENWGDSDRGYRASYELHEETIKLLSNGDKPAQQIHETAKRLTIDLIDKGLVPEKAVESLKHSLSTCDLVTLNTANYVEAAKGFVEALYLRGLLNIAEYNKLSIISSTINWESFTVERFNMGMIKVRSYYLYLKSNSLPINRPNKVFIEDPFYKDFALADEGLEVVVVHNQKNRGYYRSSGFKRVYW